MLNNMLFARKIDNINYDQQRKMLNISFHTGVTHHYSGVPGKVYQKLSSSQDKNSYYDERIYGSYSLIVEADRSNADMKATGIDEEQ